MAQPFGQPLGERFGPGIQSDFLTARSTLSTGDGDPQRAVPVDVPARAMDSERVTSFTYPGGIVAVHAPARTREAVWKALKDREVGQTTGVAGQSLPAEFQNGLDAYFNAVETRAR